VRGVVDHYEGVDVPFLQNDGSADPIGEVGSALPAATLVVQPDKILQLKARLEARRDAVQDFMREGRENLAIVPPPGGDPASKGGVEALGRNGQSAMEAMDGFVSELSRVIEALDEAARQYGLVEESNAERLRQVPG
jgi:hypothetical protein